MDHDMIYWKKKNKKKKHHIVEQYDFQSFKKENDPQKMLNSFAWTF